MPDISMCTGTNCPLKQTCYRYWATPDKYWQSYFMNAPYDHKTKTCDCYWHRINPKEEAK